MNEVLSACILINLFPGCGEHYYQSLLGGMGGNNDIFKNYNGIWNSFVGSFVLLPTASLLLK